MSDWLWDKVPVGTESNNREKNIGLKTLTCEFAAQGISVRSFKPYPMKNGLIVLCVPIWNGLEHRDQAHFHCATYRDHQCASGALHLPYRRSYTCLHMGGNQDPTILLLFLYDFTGRWAGIDVLQNSGIARSSTHGTC